MTFSLFISSFIFSLSLCDFYTFFPLLLLILFLCRHISSPFSLPSRLFCISRLFSLRFIFFLFFYLLLSLSLNSSFTSPFFLNLSFPPILFISHLIFVPLCLYSPSCHLFLFSFQQNLSAIIYVPLLTSPFKVDKWDRLINTIFQFISLFILKQNPILNIFITVNHYFEL